MKYLVKIEKLDGTVLSLENVTDSPEKYFQRVLNFGVNTRNGEGKWVHIPYHSIAQVDMEEVRE